MLLFMQKMQENKSVNLAIVVGSVAVLALSLWLVRSREVAANAPDLVPVPVH